MIVPKDFVNVVKKESKSGTKSTRRGMSSTRRAQMSTGVDKKSFLFKQFCKYLAKANKNSYKAARPPDLKRLLMLPEYKDKEAKRRTVICELSEMTFPCGLEGNDIF